MATQNSTKERWVDVLGYENHYQVSNLGRVKSLRRTVKTKNGQLREYNSVLLQPGYHPFGYPKVNLRRDGIVNCCFIHRLVCIAFHGEKKRPYEVAHNNGNPRDCREENLRWSLPSENQSDRKTHGTLLVGERHPSARLKEADVIEVRRLLGRGITYLEISKKMGVHEKTIGAIARRETWKNI